MEVCTAPYQQRLTWLLNHQHYTCCNNITVIAAPPGLLSSLDRLYATPRMIQIYHRSPHGHPAGQTQMLVIYHQPSQPHPVERIVLVSIDSRVIALTLAASIICSAIIVR